ncbi:DUF475 domain-containing protein [Nocardioides sp. J54]|uniref:DUF475 domain-containing protein n=1 Tax=Nocardioides sp. J54 TaxID=935866 RepID=UPI00048C7B84|nr:DUF475 domain-containing protein [Nocardioides sp. J54]
MILRTFGWSFLFTALGVLGALWYGGIEGIALALILIILEISLSFDNAVVNAKVLERMSDFWQKIFLTVGIVIAVFGMRLVFPFVVVAMAAGLSPVEVIELALEKGDPETPGTYGYYLADAHHTIAAFGGMFLLMIFLNFLFEEKDVTWLSWIEKPLEKAGKVEALSIIVAVGILFVAARTIGDEHEASVLTAGLAGLLTYLVVNGLAEAFGPDEEELEHLGEDANGNVMKVVGKAAFFLFLYLEVLDASFSFDGVIGAFAVTTDPIIIAIGLGVGAFYVRSVTIYLVHQGTLSDYRYLDHGAHWAIGALAALLIVSIGYHVPEVITGLIGVAFIGAAFFMSIRANKREAAAEAQDEPEAVSS